MVIRQPALMNAAHIYTNLYTGCQRSDHLAKGNSKQDHEDDDQKLETSAVDTCGPLAVTHRINLRRMRNYFTNDSIYLTIRTQYRIPQSMLYGISPINWPIAKTYGE